MNTQVDELIGRSKRWQAELAVLRELVSGCGLAEEVKWGQPCYTLGGKNVVLLHGFKDYCALLFFKGALLEDRHHILVQQTDNVQSARQARFTSVDEIQRQRAVLRAYVAQAVALEQAGRRVVLKPTAAFERPPELVQALAGSTSLNAAFEALTPGRQRAYILHVAAAKQAKTRLSRIEKCVPAILAGKGLND